MLEEEWIHLGQIDRFVFLFRLLAGLEVAEGGLQDIRKKRVILMIYLWILLMRILGLLLFDFYYFVVEIEGAILRDAVAGHEICEHEVGVDWLFDGFFLVGEGKRLHEGV